ncbi:MAG: MFS transporter [Cyanobacteria bacterium P01_A01_bin.17]
MTSIRDPKSDPKSPKTYPNSRRPTSTPQSRPTSANAEKSLISERSNPQPVEVKETAAQGFGPVLQNRNFLMLWAGQVFSQVADKFYLVLMIALISSRFQEADQTISGWVSSIMIAFTIPAVLFGSVAGVYVDRWPKRPTLVLTNIVRGLLVLLLFPALAALQPGLEWMGVPFGFWLLLLVTFFVSTLTQFFAPAEQAAIPLVVPREHLLSANALYTFTMMLAVIAGFAAGEPLLALASDFTETWAGTGDLGAMVVVGGSYGGAGLLLCLLVTGESASDADAEGTHVWADIKDGLRYLGQQKQVRGALIQLVILFSVFAALAVLVVRLAEILPALEASQFGFLLAAGGVGMALSVALLGQLGHRFKPHRLSFYGSMGMAVMLAGLAFTTQSLWGVLGCLFGLGAFAALVGVPMQTTIQSRTPEEMRGKVFGLQNNAVNIALSLPLALAGLAETAWGLGPVLLGLASLVVTGGLLSWYIADTGSLYSEQSSVES